MILEAKELGKSYYKHQALINFNLQITEGKIIGLLGPNGSGKTTFMKMVAGLSRPTQGSLLIAGHIPGPQTKALVSFMSTEEYLSSWMTIKTMLGFFHDVYQDFQTEICLDYLDRLGLTQTLKVKALSTGMRAGLKIALALSRNAALYLLDEPLNGIDIVARDRILQMIKDSMRPESAMIITSHLVDELEPILDEVIFLKLGQTELSGDISALRAEKGLDLADMYREVYQ
jgi:ABC-2 type transport system ATP-binding protein